MEPAAPEPSVVQDGSRSSRELDPYELRPAAPGRVRVASLPAAVDTDETDLGHVLRMLRRRRAIVIGVTAVLVAIAVLVSLLHTTEYEATAEVLLRRPSAVAAAAGDVTDPERAIQNEIRFIRSDVTKALVTKRLGRDVNVTVSAGTGNDLLTFTARDGDPTAAAAAANAFAQAYLELRANELQADAGALRQQIAGVDQRLAELAGTGVDVSSPTVDPAVTEERSRLADQRAELQSSLLAVEAQLAGAGDGPRVVTPAKPPTSSRSSGLVRNVLVTLVIGALLGCIVAAIVELLDRRLYDRRDVERASGLATLATVRLGRRGAHRAGPRESFRAVHFWLFPPTARSWPQVVAVVPVAGYAGRAEIVAGLGRVSAGAGRRALLVALDVRSSRLHEVLGVSGDVGLTGVLAAGVPLDEAIQSVPGEERLSVIVAGPPVGGDLLAVSAAEDLIERLRGCADVVLLEAPPVAAGVDALTSAAVADATVLTVSTGTRSDAVQEAMTTLERCGATLRGTVLVTRKGKGGKGAGATAGAESASRRASESVSEMTAGQRSPADSTSRTQEAGNGASKTKRAVR